MFAAYSTKTACNVTFSFSSVRAAIRSSYITVLVSLPVTSRRMPSAASNAGLSGGISATRLVNSSSCRRMTSSAVAAMKSPIVAKCRNSAPSDTWARLAITAADARAYPTSTIVSMDASSRRATVSSRRCCWVLATSDGSCHVRHDLRGETGVGPKEVTRLHGRPVALAELAVAVHDGPADARRDHGGVVAVDHAAQAAVERDLLLVVAVDRRVEAVRVDHDEVGAVTLTQGARVKAE